MKNFHLRLFTPLVCVCAIIQVLAAEVPEANGRPLFVIIERNPWAMVIGSDSPTFALYDDGTLIYQREQSTPEVPFLMRKITDPKNFQNQLAPFDLAKFARHYELSSATDQITTDVWTPARAIRIYGNWRRPLANGRKSDPDMKALFEREQKMFQSLPSEIRQMLARIEEERKANGTPWLPKKIEVMFWPYEYAPDVSITWPKGWPGLNAKDSRKRGTHSYSVYLPSDKLDELQQFLKTRKERGAVLIDGKKMAESYRFPFPDEEAWMTKSGD
jgi:hypothetical protein